MNILSRQESREPCEEAGWIAYDYLLSEPVGRDFILHMRALGSLTYLSQLRQPFYRVQSDYYQLKGLQGKAVLRLGVHCGHLDLLDKVEACILGFA